MAIESYISDLQMRFVTSFTERKPFKDAVRMCVFKILRDGEEIGKLNLKADICLINCKGQGQFGDPKITPEMLPERVTLVDNSRRTKDRITNRFKKK